MGIIRPVSGPQIVAPLSCFVPRGARLACQGQGVLVVGEAVPEAMGGLGDEFGNSCLPSRARVPKDRLSYTSPSPRDRTTSRMPSSA